MSYCNFTKFVCATAVPFPLNTCVCYLQKVELFLSANSSLLAKLHLSTMFACGIFKTAQYKHFNVKIVQKRFLHSISGYSSLLHGCFMSVSLY